MSSRKPHRDTAGSWVIVSKTTGDAVFETFDHRVAARINTQRYDVLTATEYLGTLNRSISTEDAIRRESK